MMKQEKKCNKATSLPISNSYLDMFLTEWCSMKRNTLSCKEDCTFC